MKYTVTARQKELLTIIYEYIKSTGYPPTYGEMRERLGVSSNQSVIDLIEKLRSASLLRKSETAARGLTILPRGYELLGAPPLVGFLGMTSAGAPIQSIEISDYLFQSIFALPLPITEFVSYIFNISDQLQYFLFVWKIKMEFILNAFL